MKNVLLRLREGQSQMNHAEATIARYICAHPEEAARQTIRELADRAYSSPSSVVRMCRSIGFSGYKSFRQELLMEISVLGDNGAHEETEIRHDASVSDIIDSITRRNIQCLRDSCCLLEPEHIAACVQLLRQADKILLFGLGASLCVARDAYLKFLRVNKNCILNDDWHSQFLQARNASSRDAGIVFSYSGQTEEMIQCAEVLKENGTPTIAVTRLAPSPIAKLCDYLLYTAANESLFRIGAISSRLAQLNVVDILYASFVNEEYDYCVKQFVRTHISKKEK